MIEPVVEVAVKSLYETCVQQISYCINYKKNVQNLALKVKDLNGTRADVQNRVSKAKKNLDPIKRVVETWLERVEKEIERDEVMVGLLKFVNGEDTEIFNHSQCCRGWCFCLTRRKIGREAQKKIAIVDELLSEGKDFVDVSDPYSFVATEIITNFISTEDNMAFASREGTISEIMSALRDEKTYSVGIYGMGGIGKTMLKNQVHKKVIEEKLFNVIITTTVSQNFDLKKIQDDIAQTLGFQKLNGMDDTTKRAALLSRRLEEEEKILLIFDDLWTMDLNLAVHVGVPSHHKGCKILITTRIHEVCSSLKIQKIVEVKILSKEDSWNIFKKNAGDVVDSLALQTVARDVVKECGGLPLALVTIGSALRDKDKLEWDYIANQLRSSNFTDIEEMTSKVHISIKLSYDYLGNDILKRCFLLCCLFPEDHSIDVDDLLFYAIGDEMIRRDLETLVEVRARLHKAFAKLVRLGLLIREENNRVQTFSAKLHDIVRDVAIAITSGEGNKFYVKADLGLRNWPRTGISLFGKCVRLSLIGNNISELPEQPELPHLLSLSLQRNRYLEKLPNSFFKSMTALLSLDISGTRICSMPSSVSCLVNLNSLNMSYCKFHSQQDMSVLGKLKKLEILCIAGWESSISLPGEIGELSHLKSLKLSESPGLTIPPNIISRLSCLENLNMRNSFEGWEIGGTSDGSCSAANLDEVVSLNSLNDVVLKAIWASGCFSMYLGSSGAHRSFDSPPASSLLSQSQCSTLSGSPPFYNSIKVLAAKSAKLELTRCSDLKSVGPLVTSGDGPVFNNLKHLEVSNCHMMEYLLCVIEGEIPKTAFTALEVLHLYSVYNLKEIFHGPMPVESLFKNLKLLSVSRCFNLVRIFSLDVLLKLKNLEELSVEDCWQLNEVFPLEEGRLSSNEKEEHAIILLPRIRRLVLSQLRITAIWKGTFSPIHSLRNMKVMEVKHCSKLTHLFTPSIVTALQQLEKLVIRGCRGLVTIIVSEEDLQETIAPTVVEVLPKLEELYLINLPNLSSLHQDGHTSITFSWPSLVHLEVRRCKKLKKLPLTHQHIPPKLEVIQGNNEEVFEEWLSLEDESMKASLRPLFKLGTQKVLDDEEDCIAFFERPSL